MPEHSDLEQSQDRHDRDHFRMADRWHHLFDDWYQWQDYLDPDFFTIQSFAPFPPLDRWRPHVQGVPVNNQGLIVSAVDTEAQDQETGNSAPIVSAMDRRPVSTIDNGIAATTAPLPRIEGVPPPDADQTSLDATTQNTSGPVISQPSAQDDVSPPDLAAKQMEPTSTTFVVGYYNVQSIDVPVPAGLALSVGPNGPGTADAILEINDQGLVAGVAYYNQDPFVAPYPWYVPYDYSVDFIISSGTVIAQKIFTLVIGDGSIFGDQPPDADVSSALNALYNTSPFYSGALRPESESSSYMITDDSGNYWVGLNDPEGRSPIYVAGESEVSIDHNGQNIAIPFSTINGQPSYFVVVSGINDEGDFIGSYYSADNFSDPKNFVDDNGNISTISIPGGDYITLTGINDAGDIVGNYDQTVGDAVVQSGFIDWDGQIQTFDIPGATYTYITGINDKGQIVGYYSTGPAYPTNDQVFVATLNDDFNPALFSPSDYSIQSIDVPPGSGLVSDSGVLVSILGVQINNQGLVAGSVSYEAQGGPEPFWGYGQFVISNGVLTQNQTSGMGTAYDVLYKTPLDPTYSIGYGNNLYPASESESGNYVVGHGNSYGPFVIQNGQMTPLAIPTIAGQQTSSVMPLSVNDEGVIVGSTYITPNLSITPYTMMGFIYDHGNASLISVPGALSTVATAINDAGEIVGYYEDNVGGKTMDHGFIDWQGHIQTFDIAGAVSTEITGINDKGQIVGYYTDTPVLLGTDMHGMKIYASSGEHVFIATPQVHGLG